MEESNQFLQNGSLSPHLPNTVELLPNQENQHLNDQSHARNPKSKIDYSRLTSQLAENQNSLNMGSDENNKHRSLHPLEVQLQSLRIDSAMKGLLHESLVNQEVLSGNNNIINNQILLGNSGIGPSHVQQVQVGNFGIGSNHAYKGPPRDKISNHQTLAGNFGIGPWPGCHVELPHGNNTNKETVAGNSGIGPSRGYNSSDAGRLLMRQQRYNTITSLEAATESRVVSMSKEEDGSEFLVRMLDMKNPGDIEFISREVIDHLQDLMMDQFGSRVILKFFDILNEDQLTSFFDMITNNLLQFETVCKNYIGSRVIQNMIDHFTTERHIDHFTNALEQIVVPLATSPHGSYVLQHFMETCPPSFSKNILDVMAFECTHIATDIKGCSVLQRCLSFATPESSLLLIWAISNHVSFLAPHQHGNYVVQYVIKLKMSRLNEDIVNRLKGQYVDLSMNKYASNVVEHLLQFSTDKNVAVIVHEIMASPRFLHLLQDSYGNYVAQKSLECSAGHLYHKLVNQISQHFRDLRADQYGKRVLEFMYGRRKFHPKF
ncbi:pumilio homolog 12-like [Prosopis cineraria]|uniref:pumilio homolog 12-like n=1 Tax=Prosopis cineraria TaxID=364024 RepID=UPI00240F3FDC|nr:pumilio homolog 12-like [Prosopis cineraria]